MGSVVFPGARWKFYLDARAGERARRRRRDFAAAGRDVSEDQVLEEIEVRDHLDSSRRDGPLIRTPDAVYHDTTDQSLDQVVERLARCVLEAGRAPGDAP
jgi:cytidylate kinase